MVEPARRVRSLHEKQATAYEKVRWLDSFDLIR